MNSLILLRHGQSQWNLENRFTGWTDVPLTNNGILEAISAGKLLLKNELKIELIFSSILERANKTAELVAKEMKLKHLFVNGRLTMIKSKELNERDYGDLVGLNKKETSQKYGEEQVRIWRRSFDVPPPAGESLKNVVDRVSPYFDDFIQPELSSGKNILIVAHGNSLRAILIKVGLYKPEEISKIELPTGSPFIIRYEAGSIINSNFLS